MSQFIDLRNTKFNNILTIIKNICIINVQNIKSKHEELDISFMYNKKSKGPKMEPYSIPVKILHSAYTV